MTFAVSRNNQPIAEHPVRESVNTGISYSQEFEIYAAVKAANLDLWTYEQGLYPAWFVANVLVHWRMSKLVELHGQDAVTRKAKRK